MQVVDSPSTKVKQLKIRFFRIYYRPRCNQLADEKFYYNLLNHCAFGIFR